MNFSEETIKLATLYATDRIKFEEEVVKFFPIEEGKKMFLEMLESDLTNVNYSPLAEIIPLVIGGYKIHPDKHGYDGYIGESYFEAVNYSEHKPKKVGVDGKLNGGGGFADYTLERLKKDIEMGEKLKMLCSGWVDGELIFAYEFPFNHKKFVEQISNKTHEAIDQHKKRILPDFSYTSYQDCKEIKMIYISPNFEKFSSNMSKPFLEFIKSI